MLALFNIYNYMCIYVYTKIWGYSFHVMFIRNDWSEGSNGAGQAAWIAQPKLVDDRWPGCFVLAVETKKGGGPHVRSLSAVVRTYRKNGCLTQKVGKNI